MRLIRPGMLFALIWVLLEMGAPNAVAQTGEPPQFDQPPTPTCGSEIDGFVDSPLSFTVQASDPDIGDMVTLEVAGLPSGASMAPPLPSSGNPVTSVFSWTPTDGDAGEHPIDFSATDGDGAQVLCEITILVEGPEEGPDMSIMKTASPNPVFLGNELTYTLTITSSGQAGVDDVGVLDHLPKEVRYLSFTSDHFFCDLLGPHLVQCFGMPMEPGDHATIIIVVTPLRSGSITNRAEVGADPFDPDEANNTASITTRVSAKPVGGVATGAGGMARRPRHVAMVGALVMTLVGLTLLWLGGLSKHSRED